MNDKLTPADVMTLNTIIASAAHDGTISRMIDGKRFNGTVRGLRADGDANIHDTDVRDNLLHVTLDNAGGEVFWPVRTIVDAIHAGECVTRISVTG